MYKRASILLISVLALCSCTQRERESYTYFIIENQSDYKVKIEGDNFDSGYYNIEIASKSKFHTTLTSSGKGNDYYQPFGIQADNLVITFLGDPDVSATYTRDNTSEFNLLLKANYSREESETKLTSGYTYTYRITNDDYEEAKRLSE